MTWDWGIFFTSIRNKSQEKTWDFFPTTTTKGKTEKNPKLTGTQSSPSFLPFFWPFLSWFWSPDSFFGRFLGFRDMVFGQEYPRANVGWLYYILVANERSYISWNNWGSAANFLKTVIFSTSILLASMYIYMYVYMYIHIHAYLYGYVRIYMYHICISVYMYRYTVYIYIYTYFCIYA